jgi:hypothetical protein
MKNHIKQGALHLKAKLNHFKLMHDALILTKFNFIFLFKKKEFLIHIHLRIWNFNIFQVLGILIYFITTVQAESIIMKSSRSTFRTKIIF